MNDTTHNTLSAIRQQVDHHLKEGIIPFWLSRGVDPLYGGYLTCFDANGSLDLSDTNKYIVTQTRMIWGFSTFSRLLPGDSCCLEAARQGVDFFIRHFWDREFGGWFWKVDRAGTVLDRGKVVYGQSFALYALAQYTLCTGDPRGLEYAGKTFDLLTKFCADTARGGYYENLEPNWELSSPGFHAGDRKSLDIHMHLLEGYTTLFETSQSEIHRRRLEEVIEVILSRMVDPSSGCGLNQFNLDFKRIPPIAIRRTWNAERQGELAKDVPDTTSYGHNLELVWLLLQAVERMGKPHADILSAARRLGEHALQFGVDWKHGGIFRDGTHQGPAIVRDKEWWQQAESLVGLLSAFEVTRNEQYLQAFILTWNFAYNFLINQSLGEWRTLVSETGDILVPEIGNPWKACYHTGRAMHETLIRLDRILSTLA